MSHLKQREEKNCLNCNAVVNDRYCSICGQENLEPQESLWHLITHIFNDITHFDGKFFGSVKYIVTKPGFLTAEYVAGRRMAYLNPIRFYVFTSALFFFIMFTFFGGNERENSEKGGTATFSKKDSLKLIRNLEIADMDTAEIRTILTNYGIDSLRTLAKNNKGRNFPLEKLYDYRDRKEFDSLDLLGKIDAGYFKRKLINRQFTIQEKFKEDGNKGNKELKELFLHSIPQVLFITLPFFALLLKLLYVRRKKFYYVSHIIFSFHLFIFFYIDILLINILGVLEEIKYLGWLKYITVFLILYSCYYSYNAMKVFYEQSRAKTIFKFLLLIFLVFFLFIFSAIILFGLAVFKL